MPRTITNADYSALWAKVSDLEKKLQLIPKFEIVSVSVYCVPSTTQIISVSPRKLNSINGMVLINSTTTEIPSVRLVNSVECSAIFDFGADTDGKNIFTFLLIG